MAPDQAKITMLLKNLHSAGEDLIAVCSAMADTTLVQGDNLIALGNTIERSQHSYDALCKVAKGEKWP
jgi:aspartokinase